MILIIKVKTNHFNYFLFSQSTCLALRLLDECFEEFRETYVDNTAERERASVPMSSGSGSLCCKLRYHLPE